jgi:hypothetical protein
MNLALFAFGCANPSAWIAALGLDILTKFAFCGYRAASGANSTTRSFILAFPGVGLLPT